MKELEYDHLITQTSFNFKNKKEEGEYWDNLLIESPLRFKNTFSKYLHERLLVRYSYCQIFKYFFCGTALLGILAVDPSLRFFNYGFATIFGLLSVINYFRYQLFGIKVLFTENLHSDEFLEMLRDEVIKIKNLK